jgi:hypothetical protein
MVAVDLRATESSKEKTSTFLKNLPDSPSVVARHRPGVGARSALTPAA